MSKNSGNSHVSMNGKVYAFTNPALRDYCSCDIKRPTSGGMEDFWFGHHLTDCIDSKKYRNENEKLFVLYSKENHIHHKSLKNNNVNYSAGRNVNNS
ncbi:hypothetical protein BB559_000753 [Furculomyces boomerangus]|uniref:Uncharacterized protein n=1 Tax=Furculomyces boomerangus TaxID=61424 RepID=A0A2T9Z474_9FUNG|nr:hypothetical protein BB559_000752 [Furculomyces boomerangus]PVU99398.1 hypothetical protein BB559_000753 [Furculomyces boomerangus]